MVRGVRYRSAFEAAVAANAVGPVEYEPAAGRVTYTIPAVYTPDFVLPNGILVECKGYLPASDRRKLLAVLEEARYQGLELRLVFQDASRKLTRSGKATYGDWATRHGIPWAETMIPPSWWKERGNR